MHGETKSGAKIGCYLKEDQSEFQEERRLKDLAKKHSDFIGLPVDMYGEMSKEKALTYSEGMVKEKKPDSNTDLRARAHLESARCPGQELEGVHRGLRQD